MTSPSEQDAVLSYRRGPFATPLPLAFRYTPDHLWLAPQPDGRWRAGFTKFAVRMLGETVDHGFQVAAGEPIAVGQVLGFLEGFKAIVDLASAGAGQFLGGNPALREHPDLVNADPLDAGWLYEFTGAPDSRALDAPAYAALLDSTIDRLRAASGADAT